MPRLTPRRIEHWLVGACIVGAPLALGGAHTVTNAVVAVVLLIATGLGFVAQSRATASLKTNLLVSGIIAVALLATAIQLIPLPVAIYEILSPGTYDVLTLAPDWEGAWRPLSLDLPSTTHELVKLVICLCGAVLAAHLYSGRRAQGLFALLRLIALGGGAVMLLGIVHGAAGFDHPYNAFGPVAHRGLVSSFINGNHLAGFLGFASIATLALALETGRGVRWLPLTGAVAMGTGVLLTLSRGGIGAYVLSLALCAVVMLKGRVGRTGRPAFWVYGTLAGVLLLASYLAYTQVVHELWTLSDEHAFYKTEIWRPTPALLAAFPLLGVGRGAFGMAYPRFSILRGDVTFSHLENEWLQLLVDFGPIVGCILVAGILFAFVRAVRCSAERPARLIAVFALVHLALHNLTDFNLTLSAVALPAVMLLTVLSQPERRSSRDREGTPSRRWLVWAGLAILTAVTAAAAWYAITFEIGRDYLRMREALTSRSPERPAELEAGIEAIIRRHPTNFVLPLMVANSELNEDRGSAPSLHWINRAMYLSPRNPGPHRLAGRVLVRLGHKQQGLSEYRLACDYQPWLTPRIAEEILRLTGEVRDVAELRSVDPKVREMLAGFFLRHKEPELALRVLEPDGPPQSEQGLTLAANAYAQLEQFEHAHARARALLAIAEDRAAPYLLQARLLTAQGELEAALAVIDAGIGKARRQDRLFDERAALLRRLGRHSEARAAAQKLLEVAGDPRMAARAHWILGNLDETQDRRTEALRHYQHAIDGHPQNASYTLALVRLRLQLGNVAGARRALEEARARGAPPKSLKAAFDQLEAREARAEESAIGDYLRGIKKKD